jgi:signal transduction histidine kinase/CHASE3 domain sensor protein
MSTLSPQSKPNRSTPFMLGVLILLIAALVSVGIYMELLGRRAYDNAERATDLLLTERIVYSLLIDMETSTRGYVITGDPQFLQPFNNASNQLTGLWRQQGEGNAGLDTEEQAREAELDALLARIRANAESWQNDWAENEIELRRSGRVDEAMSGDANLRGKQLFDTFRESSQQLNAALSDRLRRYSTDLNNIRELELVMLIGLGLLALVSSILTLRVSRRESDLQDEITRRVDAERQRLQDVIDNLPVVVRLLEYPGERIILQNQAANEIFPPDAWNSRTIQERIDYFQLSNPGGDLLRPDEMPQARATREGGLVSEIELSMIPDAIPGSRRRHLMASAAPMRDASGKITSIVIVHQDVTRMKEIDQRKDEFIATAAHELRNPLATLSGYNQLIQRFMSKGNANPAMIQSNLGEMGRQITRMNNLVERLLDASRIQLGRLVLSPSRQDLVKISRMVISELQAVDAGTHQIKLTGPDELVGCWDAVRVEQVLTNLLSNALSHTPPNGTIEVKLEAEEGDKGRQARVEVIDEGPGIPPDQRPRLFDRYYQTGALTSSMIERDAESGAGDSETSDRPSTTQRKAGLGLGLYISYEIVKAHKGLIGVEPNPYGGTIFWFTLPIGEC